TWHRERIASPRHAIDHLPLLLWHMDEPMGDSSIIPNFLISKFAAENVKVCLSGLGGDELFGGYSRYLDPGKGRIRRAFEKMPMAAGALAPAVQAWRFSWAEELRMASNPSMEWRGYLHRLQIFDSCALKSIGFPSLGRAESVIEDLWNRFPGDDPVSRRQFIDQHTYLPDEILALTDRMSMANSLEVRTPFMDYRLVRFAQTLTSPMKQTSQHFKIFLKESLGDRVPPEVLNRPKWGFDTPLKRWLAQPEMLDLIRQLPSGECVKEGLLRASAVAALVATPESVCNSARRVWNLLVLDTWLRIRGRMSPPQESLNSLMEPETCSVL
ncbi:MAG: asnB, partial [Bryobacterales bacterium]|nr:asnB [Bryobacterales bacterium]